MLHKIYITRPLTRERVSATVRRLQEHDDDTVGPTGENVFDFVIILVKT